MHKKGDDIMSPKNGMNDSIVKYFDLHEYVDRIKLEDSVLKKLEKINIEFSEYLDMLMEYGDSKFVYYLVQELSDELFSSFSIENEHYISPEVKLKNELFFDSLQLNHTRIKKLHRFVLDYCPSKKEYTDKDYEYRNGPCFVGRTNKIGNEYKTDVFYRGAESEDLKLFMDDFLSIYKQSSLSMINSSPFLKAALVHLLFVRIHPFGDGNGRTARIIQNIKFTENINKIYNMNLKISPLNLSQSIMFNQFGYASTINNIYFDLEHNSNHEINEWFRFILRMVEDQIFYSSNKLPYIEDNAKWKFNVDKEMEEEIKKMKIKRQ